MDVKKGWCRFIVRTLIVLMMLQGIPFHQIASQYTYECHPPKMTRVIQDLASAIFSPAAAWAGTPPDPAEYTINRIAENFVDISATGTLLSLSDEGGMSGIPIGFDFTFYETDHIAVSVTANGYIGFSTDIIADNAMIPSTASPGALIAPFWDDLDPSLNASSGIYFQTMGNAPDRQFIVQYQDIPLKADPGARLTFQIVLLEDSSEIQFHYLSMKDGSGMESDLSTGGSASAGLENPDGTRGNQICFNQAGSLGSGSAFSFTLDGSAFKTGRLLGDLNGDGQVNIQDQYLLTLELIQGKTPKPSIDLVLSDISPEPGQAPLPFGDQVIDADDHARLFEAVMAREQLNPTLSISSYTKALAGETMTVMGAGFSQTLEDNSVVFGSPDGTQTQAQCQAVNADGSELTLTVPDNLSFPTSIRVDRGSRMSNFLLFLLEGVPLITSLTPDNGEPGDTITIRGYEFGALPGDNIVLFNGIQAVVNEVIDTGTMDILVVTIPQGADTGTLTLSVNSQPSNDVAFTFDTAPVVAIEGPDPDADITGLTPVTGTVSDQNLASYTLEIGAYDTVSAPLYTPIASGTGTVSGDVLGTLDPGLLTNGFYKLRLTAVDTNGKMSAATRDVVISGGNKAGIFTMVFTDLNVPVQGIPIAVKRKYDSRDRAASMDFGYGWTLEAGAQGTYSNNKKPGMGWGMSSGGSQNLYQCYAADELESHITQIRFSDTEYYRFAFVPGNVPTMGSVCEGVASYEQIAGPPGATLEIIGSNHWMLAGDELLDRDTGLTFEPDKVRLTTRDGRQYDFDLQNGVERIADTNGNSLTITESGIAHSSGKSISFARDGQGRITQVTDPMDNVLSYAYDENGDLAAFTDREGHQASFEYDTAMVHLLTAVIDPENHAAVRNEYDENGRLTARVDADGNRTLMDVDARNNQTTVTDSEGRITVLTYDDLGNITDTGKGMVYTYDENGNKTSETDGLGNTRTFTYDPATWDLLSETDQDGNPITYTWDTSGSLLSAEDPAGNITTNTVDASGNLTAITDAAGTVTNAFAYDTSGNMTRAVTLGGTWDMAYDGSGNVTRIQGPLGKDLRFVYDDNGRPVSRTAARTVNGVLIDETTVFTHDANGNLTSVTDPLGNTTTYTYDGNGQVLTRQDPLGHITAYEYDARGNNIKVTYPDGTGEMMGYDRENRLTAVTNQAGNSVLYEYDSSDRLVKTIYADGTVTVSTYDAADRLETFTNHNGNVFTMSYGSLRKATGVTCPLGHTTAFTYHATGARATQTDPLGRTTGFEYDDTAFKTPRLAATTFSDGTAAEQAFHTCGKLSSRTNELGRSTLFAYDEAGNLTGVTDPLGNETNYTYDEAGNRTGIIDANANTTFLEYDANRHLTKRILPLGQEETFAYDRAGNMISHTDFNGRTTTFEYDAMGRMTRKTLPDSQEIIYTYTLTGQVQTVTAAGRVTGYTYNLRDRVTRIDHSDGTWLSYTWDGEGNRLSVETPSGKTQYAYDGANRLTTVTDPDGNLTRYDYNNAGYLTGIDYPNGTRIEYTLDQRYRPVSITHRLGTTVLARYDYTLDDAGKRVTMSDHTGRVVSYAYDAAGRLIQEDAGTAVAYTYDPAGNRITGAGVAYNFDINNRMLSAGSDVFAYDANSNRISQTRGTLSTGFGYDSLNRLIFLTGSDGTDLEFEYDANGHRILKDANGSLSRYLVDPFDISGFPKIIEERDDADQVLSFHVHGHSRIKVARDGRDRFFHTDALGSTRMLTDGSGTVSDTYDYDAFGSLKNSTGTTANPFRFAGEPLDPESGLYYLRARYMDPATGTFLSMDPYDGNIFRPQTLHKYIYANNDPVNMIDPSGQFSLPSTLTSVSIVSTLTTIGITAYGMYKETKGIREKLKKLLTEIPGKKLNEKNTADEYLHYLRIWKNAMDRNLNNNLGDGAVGMAYDVAADLAGGAKGKLVSYLCSFAAANWLVTLPEVMDTKENKSKPAFYISCGFNRYLAETYGLQLANGAVSGKMTKSVLSFVGVWLNYFNLLALMSETLQDSTFGIPEQPEPPKCW